MAFNITNASILCSDKSNFRPVRRVFTNGSWLFGFGSDSNWKIVRKQVIPCPGSLFHPYSPSFIRQWKTSRSLDAIKQSTILCFSLKIKMHCLCLNFYFALLWPYSHCIHFVQRSTRGQPFPHWCICWFLACTLIYYTPLIFLYMDSECKRVNLAHMLLHNPSQVWTLLACTLTV